METILAIWGPSLLISGGLVTVFGNATTGLPNLIGPESLGS